jgi:hypothetical protein
MVDARSWRRVTPIARTLNTVLMAFLINLVSAELSAGKRWGEIPGRLGWWTLLIPVCIALLVVDHLVGEKIEAESRKELQRLHALFQDLQVKTVKRVFELLARSVMYPDTEGPLNIHFFRTRTGQDGRFALVKDRRFYFEGDYLPSNYSMDVAYPDEDKLVICEAFNQDTIIYRDMDEAVTPKYNRRIQNRVDPQIRWVLACPLHVSESHPLGILCVFGSRSFFATQDAIHYFECLIIQASEMVIWMMEFDQHWPELESAGDLHTIK